MPLVAHNSIIYSLDLVPQHHVCDDLQPLLLSTHPQILNSRLKSYKNPCMLQPECLSCIAVCNPKESLGINISFRSLLRNQTCQPLPSRNGYRRINRTCCHIAAKKSFGNGPLRTAHLLLVVLTMELNRHTN